MQSAFSSFLMPGRLKKKEEFFKQLKVLATLGIALFIIIYLLVISEFLFKGIDMGHP